MYEKSPISLIMGKWLDSYPHKTKTKMQEKRIAKPAEINPFGAI